jgi:methanethiol S-methyltransferase
LTGYCLLGPRLKEARFAQRFGLRYQRYRAEVPYWLPWPRSRGGRSR